MAREREVITMETESSGVTTGDLQQEAHDAAGNLIRAELGLLRKEFREETVELKAAVVAFGAASTAGLLGLQTLLDTLIISGHVKPWRGLAAGLGLLAFAGVAGFIGYRALPREAIERVAGDTDRGMRVYR